MVGPGRAQNYLISSTIVSWYFQNYLFRNHNEWWNRYNYILSVAFACGAAFCGLFIIILQESGHIFPNWYLNPKKRESYCEAKTYH